MKKMLVLLVVLLMVGCEAKETVTPKEVKEIIKQEQQVDKPKEEVKEQPKEEVEEEPKKVEKQVEKEFPKKTEPKKEAPKKTEKELPNKEEPKKKEQDDNIEPETGLAKVKDGTHLEEEAKKQEEEGIIEPEEDYNEPDYDDDWLREYGNTEEFGDYDDYSGEFEN